MRYPYLLLTLLVLTVPVVAADGPCKSEPYRAWDFWIGDWQVTSLDGELQGANSITVEESGCLLVEHWRSAQGGTGQSYNFYDPEQRAWRQVWVSAGAVIDYSGGLTEKGAMRLEGHITYQQSAERHRFRGQWTPQDDGSVLQELMQWKDEKASWEDWFTGVYTRHQSAR